jgi:HD-like signal output (HDOD) protein
MTFTRATFEEIIDRVHTIPSLPEVVTQVVKLVNSPDSNAGMVGEIMMKDPGMAAKILRMVNSVFYGLSEPVHDLNQAIAILGFKTIRSIALSISVINLFQQQTTGFSMKAYWTHSAVSACICRLVGERCRKTDPEMAFIVGLLKDIGLLLMVEHAPDETKAIIAVAREYRLNLDEAAHKVIDTDHAAIGAWLAEHWGLESAIVDAVREHRRPTFEPGDTLVAVAQFSEYLCGLKKIRIAGDCGEPSLNPAVWTELGFDKTTLVDVLAVVNDEVDRARELLRVAA